MARDLTGALRRMREDEEIDGLLREGVPGDDDEAVELRARLMPFARAAIAGCRGCGQVDDCVCSEIYGEDGVLADRERRRNAEEMGVIATNDEIAGAAVLAACILLALLVLVVAASFAGGAR